MACKSMISTMTVTTDHALRASHLMLGLVHQDLEVLIPLGVQIVVDDLAPRPVRLPHSHSAHAHIRTSKTQFTILPRRRHMRFFWYAQSSVHSMDSWEDLEDILP